jgi:hypothetical protein
MTRRSLPRDAGSAKAKVILTVLVVGLLYALLSMMGNGDPVSDLADSLTQNGGDAQTGEAGKGEGDSTAPPEEETPSGKDSGRTDRQTGPTAVETVRDELDEADTVGTRGGDGLRPPGADGSREARPDGEGNRLPDKAEPSAEELLRAELQAVRNELRELGDAVLQTTRSLDGRLDRLERERAELNRNMERMNTALESMERRVFEHRTTIARLERDIRQPGGRFDMEDPVAMPPRRLYRNSPLKLFEGQVLIHLTGFHARAAGFPAANFEITLPMLDMVVLENVGIGDRRIFHYAGREFFLEVLGTDGETWARVVITRKLPE